MVRVDALSIKYKLISEIYRGKEAQNPSEHEKSSPNKLLFSCVANKSYSRDNRLNKLEKLRFSECFGTSMSDT